MLKIFDKNHNAIGHIVKYKDLKIESDVATGDKTLSFTYLAKHHNLQNEMYLQTKDDEYVIKEVSETSDGFPKIVSVLNLEDLQKDMWQTFSVTDATIDEAARIVLADTGWIIGKCNVTKRRNAGMIQVSSLDVIQKLCTAFMCEPVFDTINKTVSFYSQRGEDKGIYFLQGLNLKKLKKNQVSYDYYTRIIPIGQDGLTIESVNNGRNYLENYQYSSKVLTYIWKDESYTDPQALMEDAELKLNDLSKPETTYRAEVYDLAKQNTEYSILSYHLGDTVTIIDQNTDTREKQRIKKLVEYPQNPNKNTCEIANTILTFEQLQQKYKEAADIINYTVTGEGRYTGTISVSDILNFESGLSGSSTIGSINGGISSMQGDMALLSLTIGEIETNYIKAETADLKYATIENAEIINLKVQNLQGDYADFKTLTTEEFAANTALINTIKGDLADYKVVVAEQLTAQNADIDTLKSVNVTITGKLDANIADINLLKSDVADIDTLIFGSASGTTIQTSFANAVIAQLGNAQIKSAMIESVSAAKITAGDIITNNVRVMSEDGKLLISDETIQISDSARVRVQIGKDAAGDYSINIWDTNGNLMFSEGGITDSAIKEAIIRDDMVTENANISASKLDIDTLFEVINEDGTHTLKSSKIFLDEKEQTLDIAFTSMTTTVSEVTGTASEALANAANAQSTANDALAQSNTNASEISTVVETVSTQGTAITTIQGQIGSKIWQQDITTAIDGVNDDITELSDKYSDVNQTLTGLSATVAEHTTTINGKADSGEVTAVTSKVAELELSVENFRVSVSDTYATKDTVEGLTERVGNAEGSIAVNSSNITLLVSRTETVENKFSNYSTTAQMNTAIDQNAESITAAVSAKYTTKVETSNLQNSIEDDMRTLESDLSKEIVTTVNSAKSEIKITTDAITNTVQGIDGRLTTVEETASALTATVSGIDGKVGNLELTAESFASRITAVEYTADNALDLAGSKNRVYEGHGSPNYTGAGTYTNQVPISTDYDGNVFNGTGYIDGYRMASGGSISVAADSTATGFIPAKAGDIFRMYGVSWLHPSNYTYIVFYDSSYNKLAHINRYYTSGTSNNVDNLIGSTIFTNEKTAHSVTVDNQGVWTFDIDYLDGAEFSYIRISAYGSGADMIVTVNEPIVVGEEQPTGNPNSPSVEWKNNGMEADHVGDLYIDTETGFIYRWDSYDGTYEWRRVKDSDITITETIATQTSEKFSWLVSSGTSPTDFTLTDRVASLLSTEFNIDALTTFKNSAQDGSATVINGAAIQTGTITAEKIAASAITTEKLNANAVTAAKIASEAITTDKLAANAVTAAKINVTDLFAQDITATGTITGVTLKGATGSFSGTVTASTLNATQSGNIGCFTINSSFLAGSDGDGSSILYPSRFIMTSEDSRGTGRNVVTDIYGGNIGNAFETPKSGDTHTLITPHEFYLGIYEGGYYSARAELYYDADYGSGVLTLSKSSDYASNITAKAAHLYSTAAEVLECRVHNSLHDGSLYVSEAGNFGLFSRNKSGWVIRMDTGGSVYLGTKMVVPVSGLGGIRATSDDAYNCGTGENRFTKIFATSGTVSTSDEREKDILADINLEDYSDIFMDIRPIAYRWKYRSDDHIYFGVGAQSLVQNFARHGYDSTMYGMIEYNELESPTKTGQTDRYGMNYQDLQMLTLMQTQKNTRELESLTEWKETIDVDFGIYQSKQEQLELRIEYLQEQLIEATQKITEQAAEINQLKSIYAA